MIMNLEAGIAADREERLDRAVFEYESAVDRGQAPERVDWIARHPDLSAELNAYFQTRDQFSRLDDPEKPRSDESTRSHRPGNGPTAAAHSPQGDSIETGARFGEFVLLDRLGEGGQGVVWKARPEHSDNIFVALKMLWPGAQRDEASIERLREDAKAIARMKHPNIIKVYFFGQDRGRWYFAMELMEGGTLAHRLDEYRSDPRRAAVLIEKVSRAIHHAHTRNPGVLHLDLKPGNILLDGDGEPRVTDFGLSARLETLGPTLGLPSLSDPERTVSLEEVSVALSRVGIVGTVPYMSPEMAEGRVSEISTSSDIYGLGAILYTMLTGRPPYKGKDDRETLKLVVAGNPARPRAINPKVDRELEAVCLRALDKLPERRYGSADALANDLQRWIRREPTVAGSPHVGKHIWFALQRHPIWVALACAGLVGLWMAATAGSIREQTAINRKEAARLAREADEKLQMIRRAIARSAHDPELIGYLRYQPDQPVESFRGNLDRFLYETSRQYNSQFDLTDTRPLFNVYLLDRSGILIADTINTNLDWLDHDFSRRDYFVGLRGLRRGSAYVSRAYHSLKDGNYKIGISTRIRDGDESIGVLVANVRMGPRLVDLDMRQETKDAILVCPMDWTYAELRAEGSSRKPPYIVAMDSRYSDSEFEPEFLDDSKLPLMKLFESQPKLEQADDFFNDGAATHYHRVGSTPLVVVLRHPYPRLLQVAMSWWSLPALAVLAIGAYVLLRSRVAGNGPA